MIAVGFGAATVCVATVRAPRPPASPRAFLAQTMEGLVSKTRAHSRCGEILKE